MAKVLTIGANGNFIEVEDRITISLNSQSVNAASANGIEYIYLCSGTMTLTLPTAIGNTNRYTVIHRDSSTLTVATILSQTIAYYPSLPETTATITLQGVLISFFSDGANWWTE